MPLGCSWAARKLGSNEGMAKMTAVAGKSITALLQAWRRGSEEAGEALSRAVYDQLRRLAHFQMRNERSGHVLQTTALVHEAYLRLLELRVEWRDRAQFFTVAARQMRRVLVDAARRRKALKRGQDRRVDLEALNGSLVLAIEPQFEILALDDALERLAVHDARKTRVVELRYFGGLSIQETAGVLDISHATVERDLKMAKAWLRRAMSGTADERA